MVVLHRLKLRFQDYGQTPYWIKVPPEVNTVGDLMDLIQRKYGLSTRPMLLLQDALLPEFEELDLLINEEQIIVASTSNGEDIASVGNNEDDIMLSNVLDNQRKMLQETTTPTNNKKLSKSQKRRWRKKRLRRVRSAEPANTESSDSSSVGSSSTRGESDTTGERVFLPRGNISSTLRRLEKERLLASQDKQWNESYLLQGSKPTQDV